MIFHIASKKLNVLDNIFDCVFLSYTVSRKNICFFFQSKKVWFLKFRNQFVKYISRISQAAFCTFVYRRIYQSISSKLTHFSHASNESLQAFSIYRTEDESSLSKYRRIPNVVNSKSSMLSNECSSIHSFIFLVDFGSFRH